MELLARCWQVEWWCSTIDIDHDGITIELDEHITVHSPAPSKRIGGSRVVKKRRKTQ
jgi:hypothetical protein